MKEKRFRVTFEIVMDAKKYHRDVFKYIATEERIKLDIENILKSELSVPVDNLEVKEINE